MPMPSREGKGGSFILDFPLCGDTTINRPSYEAKIEEVSPAWVELPPCSSTACSEEADLRTAPVPPLRFFLRSEDEIPRAYVPARQLKDEEIQRASVAVKKRKK